MSRGLSRVSFRVNVVVERVVLYRWFVSLVNAVKAVLVSIDG